MWNPFAKKKQKEIIAPAAGKIVHLEEVPDEAFSGGGMGTGFGIDFHGKNVYAPADGTVEVCFPTGHALGLTCEMGEIILHIGIDTVSLNGKGFTALAKKGDKVKAGAPVVRLDRKQLQNTEIDLTTMVVFTDGYDKPVNLDCYGDRVEAGQILIQD